jgi:hypothetical protein
MKFQPLKILFYGTAIALEVSLLHLGVSLLTIGLLGVPSLNWFALLLICTVGLLTVGRFEAPDSGQLRWLTWQTLLICVATVAYGVKVQAGGGWSVISGWSAVWPLGDETRSDGSILGPAGLLLPCLWAWWRGNAIADHDHGAIVIVVQRGVLTLVVLTLLLAPLTNLGAPPWGSLLAAEAVVTVGIGLVCLSLARIAASQYGPSAGAGWHWFRSSVVVSIAILVLGVLLLSLFSPTATALVRTVLYGMTSLVALLVAPLANLIFSALTSLMGSADQSPLSPTATPTDDPQQTLTSPDLVGAQLQDLILTVLTALAYLLPLFVLLLLVLMVRRRRQMVSPDDALHESLWNWQGVGADLLSLLRNMRLPERSHGLRDALARLRSDDPVQRIRRRYLQLLIAGEAADRTRPAQTTPLEFEATIAPLVPPAQAAVHMLTENYDRARYAPDTIQPNDAASADAAWTAIQPHLTEENR